MAAKKMCTDNAGASRSQMWCSTACCPVCRRVAATKCTQCGDDALPPTPSRSRCCACNTQLWPYTAARLKTCTEKLQQSHPSASSLPRCCAWCWLGCATPLACCSCLWLPPAAACLLLGCPPLWLPFTPQLAQYVRQLDQASAQR